jgi:tetratricopeptide (TPR) repeat protein
MRLRITRTKIATLFVLLPLAAVASYWAGHSLWVRHHYQAAREALDDRDFRRASRHLKYCLDAWPNDPTVRILAAQAARRQGDLEQARRHLLVYRQQNGSVEEHLREYQLLTIQEGDTRQAAETFALCLRDPQPPDTHVLLEAIIEADVARLFRAYLSGAAMLEGETATWRFRAEQALDLWRQQRHSKSDEVQACYWAGRIQVVVDKQDAAATFRKGLELDPNHPEMRYYLALALTDYDPAEASRHLEILHRRDPGNTQVALMLASTLRGLGQLARAQVIVEEVLAANPDDVYALLERGKTALDAGRPGEAEPFLRRALTLSANEPFVHLALSRCLQLGGKSEEARFHEKRYSEIESERSQKQRLREEETRVAWRKRLEQEQAQAGGSADKPDKDK